MNNPISAGDQPSPLIALYRAIKSQHPAALVLVRVGDFYEAFDEDARTVARVLQITLTRRKDVPMAGVPAWNIERAGDQLRAAGHQVRLAEYAPQAATGGTKK